MNAALRAELAQRNADHGTDYWLRLSEGDAIDLASGFVPQVVKAQILSMLDVRREAERRAQRPVKKAKNVVHARRRHADNP